jgi:hypothetical protein
MRRSEEASEAGSEETGEEEIGIRFEGDTQRV